ncbi:MAG: alpha/beta hydrolase [Lachnospiraceae bacterium]|nr:alpha/beta hydrolase [Lachnospiraceae bacterium]
MKKEHYFQSSDEKTSLHAIVWEPEGPVKAVLQITHGMVEFIDRYDRFARVLSEQGFCVCGFDLLGHGLSVTSEEELGFFRHPDGNRAVIEDIRHLQCIMKKHYPDVPYFMLGHSMGSFFTREYIEYFGNSLTGAIIMGTGSQPAGVVSAGKAMCRAEAAVHGWHYRSAAIDAMAFGSYNKAFEPAHTHMDWLTKDEAIVDAYVANPLNTFRFTVNGYYTMFTAIGNAQDPAKIAMIPKDLPILLVSGEMDPVGGMGKGVQQAYESYKKAGIANVQMHLFENDRHEILNETDHEKVDEYILSWLEQRI